MTTVHVFDEASSKSKDFCCRTDTLLQSMRYDDTAAPMSRPMRVLEKGPVARDAMLAQRHTAAPVESLQVLPWLPEGRGAPAECHDQRAL